jgi:hypothetical protein
MRHHPPGPQTKQEPRALSIGASSICLYLRNPVRIFRGAEGSSEPQLLIQPLPHRLAIRFWQKGFLAELALTLGGVVAFSG